MNPRKKKNSSKVNLTISVIFHSLLVIGMFYLAARQGILGKKLKTLTVTAVKEKKPEPPKEKPTAPKTEQPKPAETPKMANVAPPPVQAVAPPPPTEAAAVAAPPPAIVSGFEFHDGAKEVETVSDPKVLYKTMVEHALRSRWNRPENAADDAYVAEVELDIAKDGTVTSSRWLKGSGDRKWDDSVKAAVAATKALSRPPPKGFPPTFLARFDVETARSEPVMRLSTR